MANPVDYALTDLAGKATNLYLKIAGRQIPLVQCTLSFMADQIPQAFCLVGTGFDAYDVSRPAPIDGALADLLHMLPGQIVFQPGGDWDTAGTPWPDKPVVIFDGYFVGVSLLKTGNGKLNMAVRLIHWLSDLAFSSCLTREAHPASAPDLTFQAAPIQVGAGARQLPANLGQDVKFEAIEGEARQDIWSAVKDVLYAMTKSDIINVQGCVQNAPQLNLEAQAAFDRMPGGIQFPGPTSPWYKPLQVQSGGLDAQLGQKAAEHISSIVHIGMAPNTFWDVIVSMLGPLFQFNILPLVQTAIVAPVTPGFRTPWQKRILQSEIFSIDGDATILRPLRAVAVHATGMSRAGASKNVPPSQSPAGCFAVNEPKGVVLYQHVPPWLSDLTRATPTVANTTGTVQGGKPIPSLTTPAVVPPDRPAGLDTGTINALSQALYGLYAQSIYIRETLRGRFATVSGKLRFDIGPGSNVQVQANADQFTRNQGKLSASFFGTVVGVHISLDAEGQRGQTTFQLAHVRTDQENTLDRTSIGTNPLYGSSAFTGAPLVDQYLFG